jgi:hypothetical protein
MIRGCFLLIVATAFAAPAVDARRLEVSADGGRGGERLQQALADAHSGDSLLLAPGLYRGTYTLRPGVSVIGLDGPDSTTLDADGGRYVLFGTNLDSTTVISGLTIQGGHRDHPNSGGGGIYLRASSPMVINNVFRNHLGYFGPGVYMNYDCRPVIAWNVFHTNEGYLGGALAAYIRCHALVYNNVLVGNRAVSGGGIMCMDSAAVIVANTLVANQASSSGSAIYCDSSPALIESNIIAEHPGSPAVFWLNSDPPARLTRNLFWGNSVPDEGGECPPLIGHLGNRRADPQLESRDPMALARVPRPSPGAGGAGAQPWNPRWMPVVPDSIIGVWREWIKSRTN